MFDTKAMRMQLYHHDNGKREFIRREVVTQSVIERDDTGQAINSWDDFFQNSYYFGGYGSVVSDAVQPAFSRHFHWEIHNVLPEGIRPPDGDLRGSTYISAVADNRGSELMRGRRPRTIYEKMTLILGTALICEMLLWGIAIYVNRGS